MHIIVVAQNKGGEGKTTESQVLASYYSEIREQNVLLIDMDGQCSLSNRYLEMEQDEYNSPDWDSTWVPPIHPDWEEGCEFEQRSCFADIYEGKLVAPYPTENPRLDIIPGWSAKLDLIERHSRSESKERILDRPRLFLKDSALDYYHKIIIDTPPKKNALTIGAIRAADHVIIPCQMEQMSIEGLVGMFTLVYQQNTRRGDGKEVIIAGILPNKVDNRVQDHKSVLESLKKSESLGGFVINEYLPLRSGIRALSATPPRGTSPFQLPKNDPVYKECLASCEALDKRLLNDR